MGYGLGAEAAYPGDVRNIAAQQNAANGCNPHQYR